MKVDLSIDMRDGSKKIFVKVDDCTLNSPALQSAVQVCLTHQVCEKNLEKI